MNTHLLEIFFNVGKYKSISKAAESMFLSQPAISSQMKKLERLYNVKLYEKDGRGIKLTYLGQQLYNTIHPFFSSTVYDVESLLSSKRKLKISGNYLMTQLIIPDIIESDQKNPFYSNLFIKSMSSEKALLDLENEYCDLVLISSPELPLLNNQFEIIKLFDDHLILLGKKSIEDCSTIILSGSKIFLRDLYLNTNKKTKDMPLIIVDSTQDAIANIRIDRYSTTIVSSSFTHFLKKEYYYKTMPVKSDFYAVFKKKNPYKDEISNLANKISNYLKVNF